MQYCNMTLTQRSSYRFARMRFVSILLILLLLMNMVAGAATISLDSLASQRADIVDHVDTSEEGWPSYDEMTDFIKEWTTKGDDGEIPDPTTPEAIEDRVPKVLSYYSNLLSMFPSKNKYKGFIKQFSSVAEFDDDGDIVQKESAVGEAADKKFKGLYTTVNNAAGSAAVSDVTSDMFGSDKFDPKNNFLSPLLESFYYIINTFFSGFSQLMFWGFLGQLAADMTYVVTDLFRWLLVPIDKERRKKAGKEQGFCIPVVSNEAYDTIFGNNTQTAGKNGDSALSQNKAWILFSKKTPLLIIAAVYIILVKAGWYQTFINVTAGLVTNFLSYVLRFFGLV